MRAVFWEAEVDRTERLGASRLGIMMSTALGVEGKEDALYPAAARPLLPLKQKAEQPTEPWKHLHSLA